MEPRPIQKTRRPDLADRALILMLLVTLAAIVVYLAIRPELPLPFQRPGSPLLQSAAIIGALLLTIPFAFSIAKRSGLSTMPNRWFIAHVTASLAGFVLIVAHTTGSFGKPPALLLLAFLALAASGAVARLRLSDDMAATLGSKARAFAVPDPALREQLRRLIAQKTDLLAKLEPSANEATFSVRLGHWLTSPRRAFAYTRLAEREAALIGARRSVPLAQAYWRPLHIALAWLFLLGLLVHIAVVTFFAGWAAEGRDIYWWHVTAW